ncbi:MAG: carbohydrate-binding module family 20 domain-containing protein [Verrucomicrobiota bacterium]
MIRKKLLLVALALSTALGTLAVPVTFQVDMSYQFAQGLFDPANDQIEVRGSFNNWSGGFALASTASKPYLYTGTTEVAGNAGTTVEFKFVRVSGGAANWESINNRAFTLADSAQTLPVSFFNNEWDGAPLNVTFRVNMASQIAAGNFDPAAGDVVQVRGEFNGWGEGFVLEPDPTNPDIFIGTTQVPSAPGSQVQYKFHIRRAAGGETWENDPNRRFTQTETDQTLPVVYFNNVTGVPIKAALTVAVDMTAQIAGGRFDPATQEVYVRGNKIGWGNPPEGLQLLADATRNGIYTNTILMNGFITGDSVEFKFTIWDPNAFTTTWEDGANKVVTFTGSEPLNAAGYRVKSYGPEYFNGVRPSDLLSADTLVTFRVDMKGAVRFGSATPFDPANEGVFINGSFVNNGNWGPWGTQNPELQLADDGVTHGDAVAGDGIYTFQYLLPRGSSTRIAYKYGINSEDNEAGIGNDHVRYIRATGTYTLPLDKFGAPVQETAEQDLGTITITRGPQGSVTLNWSGAIGVKLQRVNLDTGAATDVAGTEGKNTAEIAIDAPTGFFRLVKP